MNRPRKQSGFVLLAAVAVIPLVGIGITLIYRYACFLSEQTSYRMLQTEARNLALSAQAWARLHQADLLAAAPQRTWTLPAHLGPNRQAECSLTRLADEKDGAPLLIRAVVRSGKKQWTIRQTLMISRIQPTAALTAVSMWPGPESQTQSTEARSAPPPAVPTSRSDENDDESGRT